LTFAKDQTISSNMPPDFAVSDQRHQRRCNTVFGRNLAI
jgi:hypothetical protein